MNWATTKKTGRVLKTSASQLPPATEKVKPHALYKLAKINITFLCGRYPPRHI
jgi:hypothetical protein